MIGKTDILLTVNAVSKKFSRDLRKSMAYGIGDLMRISLGIQSRKNELKEKEFRVINKLSLELKRGDILGILGVNGAGKTTLLRLISGIYSVDEGEIQVNGKIVSLFAATLGMHPLFTGRENIYVRAAMYGLSRVEVDKRIDAIIAYAELENFIDSPMGIYSSGMRARLGFAIAIHADADIIIIDEGLAVGDMGFRAKAFKTLRELKERAAILIVSHSISQISQMANRIMVLEKGEKIFETTQVQKGIDYYINNCIHSSSNAGSASANSGLVFSTLFSGNQKTSEANESLQLDYGDELGLEFTFRTPAATDKLVMQLELVNSKLETVAVVHSETAKFRVSRLSNSYHIKVVIPQLPLRADKYKMNITVRNSENDLPVVIAHAIHSFVVKSGVHSIAHVQLMAVWSQQHFDPQTSAI